LNGAAWILATHPKATVRDSNRAVLLAERAAQLTNYQDGSILDTLGAAYAAAGDFENAIKHARAGLSLILLTKDATLADRILYRLDLYGQEKPFIDILAQNQ
jgi:Flp pilus assembly protein TadD